MATAQSYPYERGINDFTRTVRLAQRAIAAQVQQAIREGNLQRAMQRRMQLAAVLATLDQLGAAVDPIARRLVEDAYEQGAARAAQQIVGLRIAAPEIPGAFAGVSREAVAALQDSIVGRLRTSRQIVGRQVDDVYARAGRRAALRAVLGAEGSPRSAQRQLIRDLLRDRDIARAVQQGGAGFIDRAGKRWALDTYAEMAVRTVTREATVQGAVTRMMSHNVTLARVSLHADSCELCKPYEGRLVDLAGTTRDFDGEAVMTGPMPPFHPNCRHSLAPVAVRVERRRRQMAEAT